MVWIAVALAYILFAVRASATGSVETEVPASPA
jgi:hypothetical protein